MAGFLKAILIAILAVASILLADVPVSFSMTTVTTRHYKDLEYDYGPDGHTLGDYDD